MLVNLSWNISLLTLVKRVRRYTSPLRKCCALTLAQGGAVLTFIAAAVSLPIAHLAFALNWPLLPATPLHWEDGIALAIILGGLILCVSRAVAVGSHLLQLQGGVDHEEQGRSEPEGRSRGRDRHEDSERHLSALLCGLQAASDLVRLMRGEIFSLTFCSRQGFYVHEYATFEYLPCKRR